MRRTLAAFALAAGVGLVGSPAMAQEAGTPAAPAPAPTTAQTLDDPVIQPMGATCIQNCTGQVYASIKNKTSQNSFTYRVGFDSAPGVGNARMQVRMLDAWGGVIAEDNHYSPAGYRHNDSREVGRSYVKPVSNVCHTLWEGGVQLGTACQLV
ncbi:hypothetical protein [Prescottella agglutinans]|uniref:Secreted protein n=1 Tax=Prescottella agglutinans TaxID=1644129 RepID=A0ABT6MJL4_9NOCA|nr:hypothetical protein [Prescottella agglutinans]MDH6284001.1 hypothetical protein [Prescottella agglutinans]